RRAGASTRPTDRRSRRRPAGSAGNASCPARSVGWPQGRGVRRKTRDLSAAAASGDLARVQDALTLDVRDAARRWRVRRVRRGVEGSAARVRTARAAGAGDDRVRWIADDVAAYPAGAPAGRHVGVHLAATTCAQLRLDSLGQSIEVVKTPLAILGTSLF